MTLTTKDIIKLLPLDKDFQEKLLNEFDGLNADQKFQVERVLWNAYDALYEARIEGNLDKQMAEVLKGQRNLNNDFYKEASQKADQQVELAQHEIAKNVDLTAVREKLESLIQEPS